jgi:hypothetical protein
LTAGQSAFFFTHGTHYGEGLVVSELGNMPPEPAMESQVNTATQAAADSEMTQRLAQADLVISGAASAPRRYVAPEAAAPGAPGLRRRSEHDPDWWVSTVNVDTVEKGVHTGPTKEIMFPNSMDIAWFNAPKVKEGDRGVWLLQKRDQFGRGVPDHAVIHPLDFQPAEQTERIRALMRTGQR